MKIYIDGIFIENLVVNSIILFQTAMLAKIKPKKLNLILGAFVGSIYVCILLIFKLKGANYLISKILLSIVMIYISFVPKKVSLLLKETTLFYTVNTIILGAFYLISNITNIKTSNFLVRTITYIISFLIFFIIKNYVWKLYKSEIKKATYIYDVNITVGKKKYKYKGLIDTGNSLKYAGTGVAFIESKEDIVEVLEKTCEKVIIDYTTIDDKKSISGYIVYDVSIKSKEKSAKQTTILCFKNKIGNGEYDMLLPYDTIEKIGGITI